MKKALFFLLIASLHADEEQSLTSPQKVEVSQIEQPKIEAPGAGLTEPEKAALEPPKIEIPQVEQPKIDIPQIKESQAEKEALAPPKIEMPQIEQSPKLDMPKIQESQEEKKALAPPKIEEPKIDMPKITYPKNGKTSYCNLAEIEKPQTGILWQHDYDKAVTLAKKEKLPLFLFFSGTDWCPWCKRLEKNILNKPAFYQGITNKYVFCLIDFPMKESEDDELDKNKKLMQEYEIVGFPTIALVDVDKGLITKIGYLAISPEEFRKYVIEATETFYSSDCKLENSAQLSEGEWERLSMNAQRLGSPYFRKKLEEKGINSCPSPFFLLEKYEGVLKEKGVASSEALSLKDRIKKADPNNIYKSHYKIALLEFHILSRMGKVSPLKVIAPLIEYIGKFGNKTPDLWKMHLMIAHYLFSKKEVKESLIHAKLSFKLAPEKIRKELAETIGSFREK